uniref:Uncharacterized protein n=1 Tax=Meloidogyne javanica TaxID=6303 RepID=A0A915LZM1_MELJA
VKQITESDGTIVGTLLVTPNCLMFDPDVDHPLVQEKGMSIAGSRQGSPSSISTKTNLNEEGRLDASFEGDQTIVYGTSAGTLLPGSYTSNASSDGESSNISNSELLPCIDEEREIQQRNEAIEREKRPHGEIQSTSVGNILRFDIYFGFLRPVEFMSLNSF